MLCGGLWQSCMPQVRARAMRVCSTAGQPTRASWWQRGMHAFSLPRFTSQELRAVLPRRRCRPRGALHPLPASICRPVRFSRCARGPCSAARLGRWSIALGRTACSSALTLPVGCCCPPPTAPSVTPCPPAGGGHLPADGRLAMINFDQLLASEEQYLLAEQQELARTCEEAFKEHQVL